MTSEVPHDQRQDAEQGDDVNMCPYCKDRKRFSGAGPCLCTIGTGEPRGAETIRLPRRSHESRASVDPERPRTRGECVNGPRPCVRAACKHNLYLEVLDAAKGKIKFNFPHLTPDQMTESCALDVADRGGATLEDVGKFRNMTRERVRQIELTCLLKMKKDRSLD